MRKILTLAFLWINLIASATTYYVSSAGNDANNGLSVSASWKTIAKVNATSFAPGDQILFNRGDTWSTTGLIVSSSGSSSNPIIFSNYGSGNLPVFSHPCVTEIQLTGRQYVTFDGIKIVDNTLSTTDHTIQANIDYGISANKSSNIVIKNCDISLVGCGIQVYNGTVNTTITNNHIYNLRMVVNTSGGSDDWGANGVIVGGSGNSITHNLIEECWAISSDFGYDGGTVEFYSNGGAAISNNLIAYNTVINCNGLLEIGAGAGGACANNTVAYNKIINCGIIGSYHSNDAYSMTITNLQYLNNDVIQTVQQFTKPGVLFYAGTTPTSGMIVLKNNIFWLADGLTDLTWTSNSFNSGQMTHTNNYYRISSGSTLNITLGTGETSSSSATLFANTSGNVSAWDLHPVTGAPVINTGVSAGMTSDFDGKALNNPPSIGVYESSSTAAVAAVPVYVSSTISNSTPSVLEMTYSMTLANILPAGSSFSVLVKSQARTVNSVVISGTKVQLTLASPILYGDVVTVAYTKPSSNPIQTAAGGQAASVSQQPVTNNVSPVIPGYVSSAVANSTPSLLEMTYNMSLANIVPASGSFSVLVNSVARTVNSVVISGTKVQLTLASPILYGNVVTVAYTKPSVNPLQTSAGGQAASIGAQSVTNNVSPVVPVYTSAAVANSTPSLLEITYNMSLVNIVPAAGSFSVLVNSVARSVNSVAISGTKVQLTLASPIIYGNVVTVAYTKPSVNPLQTSAGGQATSIGAQSVTNNVTAAIPVYTSSAVANSTPTLLEMTYNMSLANIVPAAGSFSVLVNSVARTVNSVAITGTKVQLTLASPVLYGDVVTVAYTKPSANPLQTSTGGQAASISAKTVSNNVSSIIPVYASSVVANSTPSLLEMTYSITLANIVPAAVSFSVLVNSVTRTVTNVAITGAKVQLTLASPVLYGDVVKITYTKPSANPLQTPSGGQAATISQQPVTNNVSPLIPGYVSSAIANSTPSLLEMTYNLSLANIVPATGSFSILVNSAARTVSKVVISGTKVQLTLASPVLYGDIVKVTYTKPSVNPLQTTSGGQAVSISSQPVTNNVNTLAPVYTSSAIANLTPSLLEMTYSITLAKIVPSTSSFTVRVNYATRTVSRVAISGTKVQLTLASPVLYGDFVTVSYTKTSVNPLQTTTGGQAASVSNRPVTNNVKSVDLVYSNSHIDNSNPSQLDMVYSSSLADVVPDAGSFTVLVNSNARSVTVVAVEDTKVELTLESPVLYDDIVTVAYTRPSDNPLQSISGGMSASMSSQPVTNSVNSLGPDYLGSVVTDSLSSILQMTYSMTLADIVPDAGSFSVLVNSQPRTVDSVNITGSKVMLTLESPIFYGDNVSVSYTKPSDNLLQNISGGQAESITDQQVINNCINLLPVVEITSPLNNSLFGNVPDITITTNAMDEDGSISLVEFFSDSTKIGESDSAPYSFTWNDVENGKYSLTVIATDNLNEQTRSSAIIISVGNQAPEVKITNPDKGGGKVKMNSNVTLQAMATDADGTIKSVVFYEGMNKLAELTSPPYEYTWKDISVGNYSITAVATDNFNASTRSAPITLIVENGGIYDANSDILKLYPNPNSGTFSIDFVNPLQNEHSTIVITDLAGKQIYARSVMKGETSRLFELPHIKSGTYVMMLKDKDIFLTKKFIVQ